MSPTPKVWFITGASAGLGRSMTETVLANGDITVATLRKPAILDQLAAKFSKEKLLVLKLDVTKPQEIKDAFKAAEEAFGRVDVVFNNAAYGVLGEVEGTSEEVARALYDTNFWGATNVMREAVRVFREFNVTPGGRLLNVSSKAGIEAPAGVGFYSSTKHALEGVTDALAKELDPKWNVKITLIELGSFRTRGNKEDSLVITPLHPAYTDPALPTQKVRAYIPIVSAAGDTDKATKMIYHKLANHPNPPLRLPVGKDSIEMIKAKLDRILRDVEEYKEWSEDLVLSE